MSITDFLLARIAEDEADVSDPAAALHFAPARVLAECEAKRRIVERASRSVVKVTGDQPSPFKNLAYSDGRYYDDGRDVTAEFNAWHLVDGEPDDLDTLRTLAAIYADHPDYDTAWRV